MKTSSRMMAQTMKLDVIQTGKDLWYADGLSFTCTQCGNCCTGGPGYVWLSKVEIVRIAEYLKITPEEVVEQHCRKVDGQFSLKERRNRGAYDCKFLEEIEATRTPPGSDRPIRYTRRICTIYPVRPLQCRTWPFWPENLSSRKAWKDAAKKCPGMNTGRHYPVERIHELRDAKDWPEDGPSSK